MKTVSPYKTKLCEENAYWMARLVKKVYLTTNEINQKPNEEKTLSHIKQDDFDFLSVWDFYRNSAQAEII